VLAKRLIMISGQKSDLAQVKILNVSILCLTYLASDFFSSQTRGDSVRANRTTDRMQCRSCKALGGIFNRSKQRPKR